MTKRSALQDWVMDCSIMQQSVLMSAIRGCDGLPKLHKAKALVKWYRRCVLLSAFDGVALTDPFAPGGGSFTGPIIDTPAPAKFADGEPVYLTKSGKWVSLHDWKCAWLQQVSDDFVDSRDELPAHYTTHFMHAVEIIGYKHPDNQIGEFWLSIYERLVHALHLWPETCSQMEQRLGDTEAGWKARNDISTTCSD